VRQERQVEAGAAQVSQPVMVAEQRVHLGEAR